VACGAVTARFIDSEGNPVPELETGLQIVVTPGADPYAARETGDLAADAEFVANVDRKNHWEEPKSDKDGRVTFKVLIPDATYRLLTVKNGQFVHQDFVVRPGETLDLKDIVVDRPKGN
jgi:hypothetical protein